MSVDEDLGLFFYFPIFKNLAHIRMMLVIV
jgi:hypothetical protein